MDKEKKTAAQTKKRPAEKAPAKKAAAAAPAEKKVKAPAKSAPVAATKKPQQPQKKAPQKKQKTAQPAPKKPWHREKKANPLITSRPKNFRIGGDIPPKRDLTRFVRWPWYIRLQRQKRILFNRLKVPPPINQFNIVLNRASACHLFRLLNKIRPEEKAARKKRRLDLAKRILAARKAAHEKKKAEFTAKREAAKKDKPAAEKKPKKEKAEKKPEDAEKKKAAAAAAPAKKVADKKGKKVADKKKAVKTDKKAAAPAAATEKKEAAPKVDTDALVVTEKPIVVKYGLNHVTRLVERNKAQLVVIASDVDPIELVVWLPTLCRKKKVPYCIVKNKSRLGRVVHKKTSAVLAITQVPKEERPRFNKLIETVKVEFNDNANIMKTWGGQKLGNKRRQLLIKRHHILKREEARKKKPSK